MMYVSYTALTRPLREVTQGSLNAGVDGFKYGLHAPFGVITLSATKRGETPEKYGGKVSFKAQILKVIF